MLKKQDKSCCVMCKHFQFDSASPGYSEMTPGSDAEMRCAKRVWEFSFHNDGDDEFRKCMMASQTCEQFKARHP